MQNSLYDWPKFDNTDIQAVIDVLHSGKVNYWTGNKVKEFERSFSNFVNTKFAIALANGSVALELALYAINLQKDDEVIVTPRSFIASASSIVLLGGKPVFADVELDSQNISIETIKPCITDKTKAIICVHLNGWPCDMDPIMNFAKENNIYVIEDCAQAHGSKYKGRSVGSIGDIGAWSFCQDKIITTAGEGGMITLNNENLYKRAWSYKDHGKDYDVIFNGKVGPLYPNVGTNWRMTEIQAAIGLTMLEKLPHFLERRRHFAELYDQLLENNINITIHKHNTEYSQYKYYIFLKSSCKRDIILKSLKNEGFPGLYGTCGELYLEPALNKFIPLNKLLNARRLAESSIMFPLHPYMDEKDIKTLCEKFNYLTNTIN